MYVSSFHQAPAARPQGCGCRIFRPDATARSQFIISQTHTHTGLTSRTVLAMNMSLTAGSNTKRLIFHPPHSAVANQIEKSICSRFRAKLYQHFYTPRFVFASFDATYPFIFVSESIHCTPAVDNFFLSRRKKTHSSLGFFISPPPRPLPQRTLRIFPFWRGPVPRFRREAAADKTIHPSVRVAL